jgi:hypothetical protein
MAKQNQTLPAKPNPKSQAKVEAVVSPDRGADLAGLAKLSPYPVGTDGDDTKDRQAGWLGDARFQTVQRQMMAAQVGRVQGNHHLQMLMTSLNQENEASSGLIQRDNDDEAGSVATPADVVVQTTFNPMDILHKLLIAIDQSDTYLAGGTLYQSVLKRKVDFATVVSVLSNLTAAEARKVRAVYFEHENRFLEEDLFGKGESGFESNLNEVQRAQIRALLAGTRAESGASEPEKQTAATHVASAQAAEMHRLLHGDQDKADVERMMTILRQGQAANAALNAAYTRLAGTTLEIGRMSPPDMIRASMLLDGNIIAADAFKVSTLKGRITNIDEEIAQLEDVSPGMGFGYGGGFFKIKQLREERKKLIEEIEQRGEQAAAEAQAKGESVQGRVGAVFGDMGALATQVRGPDAAAIRAIAMDDPAAKVAAQLRKAKEDDDLSAEKLATALRGLRAEAEERARRMLPPGDPGVDARATSLADEYFARLRTQYNALVPEGDDTFDEIIKETGDEGDENLNKSLWVGAGRLEDVEELVLALNGDRKDTEAVERVLRDKSATEIRNLKLQYMVRTGGHSLDFDLFGQAPTTAGEDNPYWTPQGKAEGTSRLNLEDYMQRPNVEGGIDEMWYIVARAEREYEYTIENRGVTGWWRDTWGNEQRALLDETIAEVRRLKAEYISLVGWVPFNTNPLLRPEAAKSPRAKEILQEMRLARHTIRGDRAAYEKATAELRATFEAIASFVIQAALTALLTPVASALFKGAMAVRGVMAARMIKWVEMVSVNTVSSVGGNLMVHGPDYSLAMLKADLLGGLGGQLGSDAVGKMLGPVAKGLAQRLGPKCSAEIISFAKGVGNIKGGAWAQGMEGDLSLQNIVQTHLMGKGAEVITKGVSSVTGQAPKPSATVPGGGEPVRPVAGGEPQPPVPHSEATPDGAGGPGPAGEPPGPKLPHDFAAPDDFTFTSEGPPVAIPVNPPGAPAHILEIGAGPTDTNLGLPVEPGQANQAMHDPSLVDVTRTDLQPRPDAGELNAQQPIPPEYWGQDTVIINNPRGYRVDIANVGQAVRPGGHIVIQGRAEIVKGMRGVNPDMTAVYKQMTGGDLPPGYRIVEIIELPQVRGGDPTATPKPAEIMGGPFQATTGGAVGWPNTRIVIERTVPVNEPVMRPSGGESSGSGDGGPVVRPSPNTKVVEQPEIFGKPVPKAQATDQWDKYLESGPRTNTHPRLGTPDPDRIVVQTGPNSWKSIRFGKHEINSKPTKFHYHEEMWTYDPATDTMTVTNTVIRVQP